MPPGDLGRKAQDFSGKHLILVWLGLWTFILPLNSSLSFFQGANWSLLPIVQENSTSVLVAKWQKWHCFLGHFCYAHSLKPQLSTILAFQDSRVKWHTEVFQGSKLFPWRFFFFLHSVPRSWMWSSGSRVGYGTKFTCPTQV